MYTTQPISTNVGDNILFIGDGFLDFFIVSNINCEILFIRLYVAANIIKLLMHTTLFMLTISKKSKSEDNDEWEYTFHVGHLLFVFLSFLQYFFIKCCSRNGSTWHINFATTKLFTIFFLVKQKNDKIQMLDTDVI